MEKSTGTGTGQGAGTGTRNGPSSGVRRTVALVAVSSTLAAVLASAGTWWIATSTGHHGDQGNVATSPRCAQASADAKQVKGDIAALQDQGQGLKSGYTGSNGVLSNAGALAYQDIVRQERAKLSVLLQIIDDSPTCFSPGDVAQARTLQDQMRQPAAD